MTDKTRLVESVKNWLQVDTEIKQLQQEIRKRRKMKKEMTDSLVQIMKSQDIEIMNAGESQLIRTEKKTKSALSKKHLINILYRIGLILYLLNKIFLWCLSKSPSFICIQKNIINKEFCGDYFCRWCWKCI